MKTFYAVAGQSLADVCMNTYGSMDYFYKLLKDNNILDANFIPITNMPFIWDETLLIDAAINQTITLNNIKYATMPEGYGNDLRCEFNHGSVEMPRMMDSLMMGSLEFNIFTLIDFRVNDIQYASGQTLTVGYDGEVVLFGVGLDGLIYPMNVNDWMNSIGAEGIKFYDNMRRIDTKYTTYKYYIHINKTWNTGTIDYYFTSEYGFGIYDQFTTYLNRKFTNL